MKQENKRENNQRETGKLGVAGVKLINCYIICFHLATFQHFGVQHVCSSSSISFFLLKQSNSCCRLSLRGSSR